MPEQQCACVHPHRACLSECTSHVAPWEAPVMIAEKRNLFLFLFLHVSPFQLAVQELLRKADVLLLFNRGCGVLQHPRGRVVARGDGG